MTTFPADDPDKVPFAGILPAAPKPFVLGNGEGEKSLVFDQLFAILLSADETDDQYGACTMVGPKGDRIPAHKHFKTHEIFYVVDGEISVWMDDEADYHTKTTLTTGDFAFIPAKSCTRSRSTTRRRSSASAPPASSGSSTRWARRPT